MALRLIGALLLVPLLDVLLLVVLATRLGATLTVALVVLTALVGLLLVRAEGRHTLAKMQRKLAAGTPPTDELLDGALLLVAGALMLTPGYVTDLIGLLFVLPLTRYPIRLIVKRYVITPYVDRETGGFATGNVYIGGFPHPDEGEGGFHRGFGGGMDGSGGPAGGGGSGKARSRSGEPIDVGEDDYEFTDVDAPSDSDPEDEESSPRR